MYQVTGGVGGTTTILRIRLYLNLLSHLRTRPKQLYCSVSGFEDNLVEDRALEFKQLDVYNNTLDERTEEDVRLNSPIYCYVDVSVGLLGLGIGGNQASQRPGRVIRVCSNEAISQL